MKVVLVGHPGSQSIVPASKYLTEKYLPRFEVEYLNYEGAIKGWSDFVRSHIEQIDDEFIIFALDDYLLSSPLSLSFDFALQYFKDSDVVCVKLCPNTSDEHEEYPVTTQYTIWRKDSLVWLLKQTTDPWNFEMGGSAIFKGAGKRSVLFPCLTYPTHSALSSRWSGVRLDGVNPADIEYLTTNNLLNV